MVDILPKSQNGDSCDAFSATTNLLSLNQKSNKQQQINQSIFLRKFCGRYLVDKVLCGRYLVDIRVFLFVVYIR